MANQDPTEGGFNRGWFGTGEWVIEIDVEAQKLRFYKGFSGIPGCVTVTSAVLAAVALSSAEAITAKAIELGVPETLFMQFVRRANA